MKFFQIWHKSYRAVENEMRMKKNSVPETEILLLKDIVCKKLSTKYYIYKTAIFYFLFHLLQT